MRAPHRRPRPGPARPRPSGAGAARRVVALVACLTAALAAPILPAAADPPGAWVATGSLATARSAHTATRLDGPACGSATPAAWCGTVLVAGGTAANGTATDSVEVYTPGTGAWTPGTPMGTARSGHTATTLDAPACEGDAPPAWCGAVLVAGGTAADGTATSSVELYDPATATWAPTGTLGVVRSGHTATLLPDGRVLVVGGTNDLRGELYDPTTATWSFTASLTTGRRSGHTATLLLDGRVLVARGRTPTGVPTSSAEIYNVATDTWTDPGTIGLPRMDQTATLLTGPACSADPAPAYCGKVVVAAGADATAPRASAELFEPGPARWVATDLMEESRARHTATLLLDGGVLVAGGVGPNPQPPHDRPVALAEVYDAAAALWIPAGSLVTPRSRHTATLLAAPGCDPRCGHVLVAGGVGLAGEALASGELYDPALDPPPGAVNDLAARAVESWKIRLTFSAPGLNGQDPPPATRFVVKQSREPITEAKFDAAPSLCDGVCAFSPDEVGDPLVLNVVGVNARTTYHYAVKALDEADVPGPMSNVASATTPRDTTAPDRVDDLRARALSATKVRLTWDAVGSNGRFPPPTRLYVVKQSRTPIQDNDDFRRAHTLCGGVCRFSPGDIGDRLRLTVTQLRPDTVYYYAIRAKDGAGNLSKRSNTARVRTR